MPITIKSLHKPYNTPIAALILQANAELLANGFSDGSDNVDWDCNVLYAEADGRIIGFVCWKTAAWKQEAQIALGYVVPECRGRGVYTRLFAALEAEAVRLKLRSISGYTHANNLPLQAAARSQGRELFSLGYRKRLPLIADTVADDEETP